MLYLLSHHGEGGDLYVPACRSLPLVHHDPQRNVEDHPRLSREAIPLRLVAVNTTANEVPLCMTAPSRKRDNVIDGFGGGEHAVPAQYVVLANPPLPPGRQWPHLAPRRTLRNRKREFSDGPAWRE